MKSNRQEQHSSPEQELSFIQPFGGEQGVVSEKEQQVVAERFISLFEETLMNNPTDAQNFSDDVSKSEYLTMHIQSKATPQIRHTLALRATEMVTESDYDWQQAEEVSKSIGIQVVEEERGGNIYEYRLGSDGVVRRHDITKQKLEDQRAFKKLGKTAVPGETHEEALVREAAEGIEELLIGVQNSRLEREMGLNDQPISLTEMEGLEDFVRQEGFEVPSMHRRYPKEGNV